MPSTLLNCPIRGRLTVPERATDDLTFTEEKRRIDCIKYLMEKGYPPTHILIETTILRFGSQGRNSFRTDVAVLNQPVTELGDGIDDRLHHMILVAEIKRDNTNPMTAVETQVYPALGFLPNIGAFGIYWDDVEQRLFYRSVQHNVVSTHETTISALPFRGGQLEPFNLTIDDLTTTNLRHLFERIENRLHAEVTSKSRRFEIMLQLLLMKLYDENVHPAGNQQPMGVQDFTSSSMADDDVEQRLETILHNSLGFYQTFLPNSVRRSFNCTGSTLRSISALLAPVRILNTRRDVVQDFYMYFASEIYKWDLGQYFTPTAVVDFIVAVVNPRAGEHVNDPACGSGDFLISAFQYAQRHNRADITDSIWGTDKSSEAVQVAVLNMVLNGDGKSQIKEEDSLANVGRYLDQYSVTLCNPPFGVKITEKRSAVLTEFDLGYKWKVDEDGLLNKTGQRERSQQVGILFAELCVRQAAPGGRIGIILPNGYLGNRSDKYVALREWLIRHARITAIVAFPRFTFKRSGADVSASAVFMEKRVHPLPHSNEADSHPFYAGIIESVGWSVSDRRSNVIYRRDPETGTFLTDENNERITDSDFARALSELRTPPLSSTFPWLNPDSDEPTSQIATADFADILSRGDLSLDPKRWCQRFHNVRSSVASANISE